jgi:asparagine synthase (glutamine-hydrolysing)
MCGISGIVRLGDGAVPDLEARLDVMNHLLRHRGPDGVGAWCSEDGRVGLAHRRLSIIDLTTGEQPMVSRRGDRISYNGEIYNYRELRDRLGASSFRTTSDTEVILRAYEAFGDASLSELRGMFAFALWDDASQTLLCARDRFGMKPFYYTVVDGTLYFASEAKALMPFIPAIATDVEALRDYLAFQFCLEGKTLFEGIRELPPGHLLRVANGQVQTRRYWDLFYDIDFDHTGKFFEEELRRRLEDSVRCHLRADVPIGTYLSGGLDSSLVASLAAHEMKESLPAFHGRFDAGPAFDESSYARLVASERRLDLHEVTINVDDFIADIRRVIYHLDYPVAGPGAFPQFEVSRLASQHRKVVLGGQGGDELFGGYARYLIAYFEQCLKGAIDGTMDSGNFIVSYESILPNLVALRRYKPLLQEFWRDGLFDEMDARYFRLINRSESLGDEVRWEELGDYSPFDTFRAIFNSDNLGSGSYFDRMTHFDFKTLLPALLQVEDRMSMAHGLESRLPLLDHPLVELSATIPSNVKFEGGTLKRILKTAFTDVIPAGVVERTDKMGFPTPINDWAQGPARAFVIESLSTRSALSRPLIDNRRVLASLDKETTFGRHFWGFLSLEIWQQEFHDKHAVYRDLLDAAKEGRLA